MLQWGIDNDSPRWKQAIGRVGVGGGLVSTLLWKVWGELWLILPRMCIAIGLERTRCFLTMRHCYGLHLQVACQTTEGLVHCQDCWENDIHTYFLHQCIVRFSVSTASIVVANISRFGRPGKWILLVMKHEVLILIQHGT